jgi:tellurite resistance-related uncharacterized protein
VTEAAGLPPGLTAYRRTPVFDQDTIPPGLRREHRTGPGVWGLITVLTADRPGVVAPEQVHQVEPLGPVQFFVEFYRRPPPPEVGAAHVRPVGSDEMNEIAGQPFPNDESGSCSE